MEVSKRRCISSSPREPKPEWLKVRAPGSENYLRLQGHHARPEAQHGLRGRALPQHRRVLAPWHRHLHDPRRRLHARLRLLRGDARQAGDARSRRAARASPKRCSDAAAATPSSPRSIATTWPTAAPAIFAGDHPRDQGARARLPRRSADSRLQGRRGAAARPCSPPGPDILNHNTETVPRLYRMARSGGKLLALPRAARSRAPASRRRSRPRPA